MAILEQELGIRLSQEQTTRLRQAASLTGLSLDDFAVSAVTRAVEVVLAHPPMTILSERDFARLEELLDAEVEPAEALKAVAAEYARQVSQGTLHSAD